MEMPSKPLFPTQLMHKHLKSIKSTYLLGSNSSKDIDMLQNLIILELKLALDGILCNIANQQYLFILIDYILPTHTLGGSIAQSVVRLTISTTHKVQSCQRSEIFQCEEHLMPIEHVTNE